MCTFFSNLTHFNICREQLLPKVELYVTVIFKKKIKYEIHNKENIGINILIIQNIFPFKLVHIIKQIIIYSQLTTFKL